MDINQVKCHSKTLDCGRKLQDRNLEFIYGANQKHKYNTRLSAKNILPSPPTFETSGFSDSQDSTILDDSEDFEIIPEMSLNSGHSRFNTHLNPCSEPNIVGCGLWMKAVIIMLMVGFLGTSITLMNGKYSNIAQMDDKNIDYIKKSLSQVRDYLQSMLKTKHETGELIEKMNKVYGVIKQVAKDVSCANPNHAEYDDQFEIYNADKTGKADYALETAEKRGFVLGGSIVSTKNTKNYNCDGKISIFGWTICCLNDGAKSILQPNVAPGNCWDFIHPGNVVIKLLSTIYITGVTIEHIPKSIAPNDDITSAPKNISVYGLICPDDANGQPLGKITFDINASPVQYFEIEATKKAFKYIEIIFKNNHGHPNFTCVYRVRVHGTVKDGQNIHHEDN